jgi:hypothetical protein
VIRQRDGFTLVRKMIKATPITAKAKPVSKSDKTLTTVKLTGKAGVTLRARKTGSPASRERFPI